jgi:hypothetical protein
MKADTKNLAVGPQSSGEVKKQLFTLTPGALSQVWRLSQASRTTSPCGRAPPALPSPELSLCYSLTLSFLWSPQPKFIC